MILLSYGFTFVVGLAVIILLAVAASAIWQSLRADKELKQIERQQRSERSENH